MNPQDGSFTTSYYAGRYADSDGVNPAAVPDSPYIDSVFFIGPGAAPVPGAGTYDQAVTQSGVRVRYSEADATGSGWNFILKNRVGGVSAPGLKMGGIPDPSSDGSQFVEFTTAIGLHTSVEITFDLDARTGDGVKGISDASSVSDRIQRSGRRQTRTTANPLDAGSFFERIRAECPYPLIRHDPIHDHYDPRSSGPARSLRGRLEAPNVGSERARRPRGDRAAPPFAAPQHL